MQDRLILQGFLNQNDSFPEAIGFAATPEKADKRAAGEYWQEFPLIVIWDTLPGITCPALYRRIQK